MRSTPTLIGTAVSDASGRYRVSVRVPPDASAGAHTIAVLGRGPDGHDHESAAAITVRAAGRVSSAPQPGASAVSNAPIAQSRASTLGRTGTETGRLAFIGLLAITLGAQLVRTRTVRRES